MSTLPTTRTLLTSLFNTLTATTEQQSAQQNVVNEPYDLPSNPLKSLSSSHKALLSTLHVLFTPPMLLQALDLLDRGLVVRIVEQSIEATNGSRTQAQDQEKGDPAAVSEGDEATTTETGREIFPPQANIHLPSSPPLPGLQPQSTSTSPSHQQAELPALPPKSKFKPNNAFYQVRSSQPPKSRFRDPSSSTSNSSGNIYTVRLEAWNCSCAAFTFASFPASSVYPSKSPWNLDVGHEEDVDLGGSGEESNEERREEGEKWEFGGMSRDGKGAGAGGGGGVPCCKHLLACVLGERWGVLSGYVKERVVSREEMAGLGCE